jgi:low affinity Fe/Cu permease
MMSEFQIRATSIAFALLFIAVGLVIGIALADATPILGFVETWQTLIGAVVALFAALMTIQVIRQQISSADARSREQAQEQKIRVEDSRRRKSLAARALLPVDLSEAISYAEDCSRLITEAIGVFHSLSSPPVGLACPALPERIISNMQELIEHLPDSDAQALADMMGCYQVQRSRISGEFNEWNRGPTTGRMKVYTLNNIEFLMLETIKLHLLAENIFEFARRKVDTIPSPEIDMVSIARCIRRLDMEDVLSTGFQETLVRTLCTVRD